MRETNIPNGFYGNNHMKSFTEKVKELVTSLGAGIVKAIRSDGTKDYRICLPEAMPFGLKHLNHSHSDELLRVIAYFPFLSVRSSLPPILRMKCFQMQMA